MASAQQASYQEASHQQQQRFVSQQQEENVREMEQIRHTNATLDMAGSDSFRAQTEQAAIRIVTPHYKIPDKPGTDVKIGSSVADLSAKFAEANGADYKAERAQEHFRMQIIDPKVASHAHIPGHAIRDYARRHLIGDFPSLHGKRSFLDLDALEQLRLRKGNLGEATDRDRDLDKFLKNRDGKRWDLPAPPKPDDESLRELDRLRQNIDHLQKASFRRSKSLCELRPFIKKMPKMNGEKQEPIEVSIEERRHPRTNNVRPMPKMNGNGELRNGLLTIGGMKEPQQPLNGIDIVNGKEKHQFGSAAHFSPSSQFFAQQINCSPSSSKSSSSSSFASSSSSEGVQKFGQKSNTIKKRISSRRLVEKEDKAIQASIEPESPPPNWCHRQFLLVGNEEGANILEWQSQIPMQSNHLQQQYGGDGQHVPKSILKQPIQQQSAQMPMQMMQQQPNAASYSIQHEGGTEPGGPYWEDRGEIGLRIETDEQQAIVEQMQRNLAMHKQPSPLSRQSPYPAVPFDGPFFRLHEISPGDGRPIPVNLSGPNLTGPYGANRPSPSSAFNGANGGNSQIPQMTRPSPSAFGVANGAPPPPPPPPPPPGWTPMKAAAMQQQQQGGMAGMPSMEMGQRGGMPEGGIYSQMEGEEEDGTKVIYWPPLDAGQQKAKPELPPPKNIRDPERLAEFMRQERQQQEAEMAKEQREAELRERQIRAIQMQQQQQLIAQHQQQFQSSPSQMNNNNNNHVAFSPRHQSAFGHPSTSHSQSADSSFLPSPHLQIHQINGQNPQNSPRPALRVFEARPLSSAETDYAFQPQPTTWRRTYILDAKRTENVDERNEILTSEETLQRERFDIDLLKRRESFIEKPERPPEIKRLGRRWEPPPEKPYRWPSASPGPGALSATQSPGNHHNQSGEHRRTPIVRDPGFKTESKQFTPEPSPPGSPIRGHGTGPLEDVAFRQNAGLILPSPDGSHRPRTEFSRVRKAPSGGFVPHAPNAIRVIRRKECRVEEEEEHIPNDGPSRQTMAMNGDGGGRISRQTVPAPDDEYDYMPNGDGQYEKRHHPPQSHRAPSKKHSPRPRQSLPRHSSTIVELEPLPRVEEVHRRIKLLEARSERSQSTVPSRSSGARSPSAQRSLERMQRLTAPSLAPASYKRAKRFVPAALPPGVRARHIPRVDRSSPQIIKSEYADFKDQIREMLEMNGGGGATYSGASSPRQNNGTGGGGGYFTDTSASPTWQFNMGGGGGSSSFSPHSLVSVNGAHQNGHHQNGLLKVVNKNSSFQCSSTSLNNNNILKKERSIVKVEPPQPIQRKEIVEVRREIIKAPTVKHTVHRVEEKKRTEEVERRVIRRERRHKSRRMHRSHHSSSAAAAGGGHHEYHYGSWGGTGGGGGGYRSSSASRRSAGAGGYTNGFGGEHHLPIAYDRFGRESSAASDRFFGRQNGHQHARYGSVSDSLRRGDLKYGPNGELLVNGADKVKHHRVHKAHSTRDVFYHGDGGNDSSHYSTFQRRGGGAPAEPFVEFPPTLDRRSDWSAGGPEPPPHRRQFADEFGSAGGGLGVGHLTKARSLSNWEGRDGLVPGRYGEDMARLENEFRDARLMRIPSGNMHEKEHHHREIPGGYESYSRETKAHSDRKLDGGVGGGGEGTPVPVEYSREASQDFKRDGGGPK